MKLTNGVIPSIRVRDDGTLSVALAIVGGGTVVLVRETSQMINLHDWVKVLDIPCGEVILISKFLSSSFGSSEAVYSRLLADGLCDLTVLGRARIIGASRSCDYSTPTSVVPDSCCQASDFKSGC